MKIPDHPSASFCSDQDCISSPIPRISVRPISLNSLSWKRFRLDAVVLFIVGFFLWQKVSRPAVAHYSNMSQVASLPPPGMQPQTCKDKTTNYISNVPSTNTIVKSVRRALISHLFHSFHRVKSCVFSGRVSGRKLSKYLKRNQIFRYPIQISCRIFWNFVLFNLGSEIEYDRIHSQLCLVHERGLSAAETNFVTFSQSYEKEVYVMIGLVFNFCFYWW